jgi:membrane-bound ClpP family serine protease
MKQKQPGKLPFTKTNYILMITGVILIIIGYIVISLDKEPYGFGLLGITIGPIMLMLGFVIQFFAIMYTEKRK